MSGRIKVDERHQPTIKQTRTVAAAPPCHRWRFLRASRLSRIAEKYLARSRPARRRHSRLCQSPGAVLVGWDTLEAATYRHEAFADYQSGREFDDDLVEQLAL